MTLRSRLSKKLDMMRRRCSDKTHRAYRWYGAKGIKVKMTVDDLIALWLRDNANKMDSPSIDRINSNGDYEPRNCRFIELSENRGTSKLTPDEVRKIRIDFKLHGKTKNQLASEYGVCFGTIKHTVAGRIWKNVR